MTALILAVYADGDQDMFLNDNANQVVHNIAVVLIVVISALLIWAFRYDGDD